MNFLQRSDLILPAAWLVLCLAAVTAGMTVRLAPVERDLLPAPFPGGLLAPAAIALTILAVLLLWVGAGHARGRGLQRPLAELIFFFPLVFAYLWLLLPARGVRPGDLAALALFAAGGLWLLAGSRGARPAAPPRWRGHHLLLDGVLVLGPVALGAALGVAPDYRSSGVSVLLYPLYALAQLAVFLVVPAHRLRACGLRGWTAAVTLAAVFALVHAPNPVVMAATFGAMLVWARQYLQGRRLWQLALVMGLSATTFTQFLSDDFTGHMRVGPGYLQERAGEFLAEAGAAAQRLDARSFLALAYPACLDRRPTPAELDVWDRLLDRARRTTMAWQFFTSDEYARRAAEKGWPPPPPEAIHWADYDPVWRDRIAGYDSDEYWARCGGTLPGFTKSLYRDILQRPASSPEVAAWTGGLARGQRKRLAVVLLDNAARWRSAPFTGLPVKDLRLPR